MYKRSTLINYNRRSLQRIKHWLWRLTRKSQPWQPPLRQPPEIKRRNRSPKNRSHRTKEETHHPQRIKSQHQILKQQKETQARLSSTFNWWSLRRDNQEAKCRFSTDEEAEETKDQEEICEEIENASTLENQEFYHCRAQLTYPRHQEYPQEAPEQAKKRKGPFLRATAARRQDSEVLRHSVCSAEAPEVWNV